MQSSRLSVNSLHKTYYTGSQQRATHALQNVSFDLQDGEVLGIIGPNGSGKSTLLKILSGLVKPDNGYVTYHGRLLSILDVGYGFHPDLSGIENIYLTGALNGFTRQQMNTRIDEIAAFSELSDYLETPVKYYSAGMFLRLAFSTILSLEADILVLDEVTQVGDMGFQIRSFTRLKQLKQQGKTIVLSSHDLTALQDLATKGLYLKEGQVQVQSDINAVIRIYHNAVFNHTIPLKNECYNPEILNGVKKNEFIQLVSARIVRVEGAIDTAIGMDNEVIVEVTYIKNFKRPVSVSVVLHNHTGSTIMSICSHRLRNINEYIDNTEAGNYQQLVTIPGGILNCGLYTVSIYFTNQYEEEVTVYEKLIGFDIKNNTRPVGNFNYTGVYPGSIYPSFIWKTVKL